jgi:hypothetical protein
LQTALSLAFSMEIALDSFINQLIDRAPFDPAKVFQRRPLFLINSESKSNASHIPNKLQVYLK